MKFENKYIKIKTKKKEITLHNYIYDSYLALFSKCQYETDQEALYNMNQKKNLYYCYIKFDNNMKDITKAQESDFDIYLEQSTINVTGNSNSVSTSYTYACSYKEDKVYDLALQKNENINKYANKKITALAFGSNHEIMSCVDTSNYDVHIVKDENFMIARKDIMITDAICDGIELPLHIASVSNQYELLNSQAVNVPVWAKLYSVGLGRTKSFIDDEYVIGEEIEVIKESDTVFGFNLLKGFQQSIFPHRKRYASNGLYPLPEYTEREEQPLVDGFCGSTKFPLQSNYKYIIYKFQLYYYDTMQGNIVKLNRYYTLSYPETTVKGLFQIKTKIERSN